jgi:tetratricopeptide (TPR) repeat protein
VDLAHLARLCAALLAGALLPGAAQPAPAAKPAAPPAAAAKSVSPLPNPGTITITSRSPEAVQLFVAGRDKALNFQPGAAVDLLQRALALDPDFALAIAWLGRVKGGPEGLGLAERAARLAAALPEPERLQIDVLLAERHGDDEAQRRLKRQLADLAPNDWLALFLLGVQSQYDHKSQATILYLNRAVALNPLLAEAYNYLGFVQAQQGMREEGIASARKFVALKPDEPNAHDSLGEVLLLVGELDEAEVEFKRALELDPRTWMSAAGLAYARAFRGNFAGARAATALGRKAPLAPREREALLLVDAWGYLAEGKPAEALETISQLEREGVERKDEAAQARAHLQVARISAELGRLEQARTWLARCREHLARAPAGEESVLLRRGVLVFEATLAAKSSLPAAGARAVSALEEELKAAPSNADVRAAVHYARGLQALAAREPERAADSFALCPEEAVRCRVKLAEAHDLAGEHRAAEEVRDRLLRLGLRDNLHRGEDPESLYYRAKLGAGK